MVLRCITVYKFNLAYGFKALKCPARYGMIMGYVRTDAPQKVPAKNL